MDGTLADSIKYHILAAKKACEKYNLEFDENLFKNRIGKPSFDIFKEMFGDEVLAKKLSEEKKKIFDEIYKGDLFPEVVEVLKALKERRNKVAVATSSRKEEAIKILKPLLKYIDLIESCENTKPKPHPEIILRIINYFKVSKDEVIFIGDTPYDWLCALNAGVKFILVDRNNISIKTLKELL